MKNQAMFLLITFAVLLPGTNALPNEANLKPGINTIYFPDRTNAEAESKKIAVDVYIPDNKKIGGDVLVLPGWKYQRTRWYLETDIRKYADKSGFRLIFPEMHISSYESVYFPETTTKWSYTPGGEWVRSVLLPGLAEKYGICKKGGNNFILGLSTGGRGVLLVALQNPGIFSAGATLSGDCDQSIMPDEKLYIYLYGDYSKFKTRWETVDNPLTEIKKGKWRIPLYIGHGKKDKVSPFEQSRLLYDTLIKLYPGLNIVFNEPEQAEHNFIYWKSEVPAVMEFFDKIVRGKRARPGAGVSTQSLLYKSYLHPIFFASPLSFIEAAGCFADLKNL